MLYLGICQQPQYKISSGPMCPCWWLAWIVTGASCSLMPLIELYDTLILLRKLPKGWMQCNQLERIWLICRLLWERELDSSYEPFPIGNTVQPRASLLPTLRSAGASLGGARGWNREERREMGFKGIAGIETNLGIQLIFHPCIKPGVHTDSLTQWAWPLAWDIREVPLLTADGSCRPTPALCLLLPSSSCKHLANPGVALQAPEQSPIGSCANRVGSMGTSQ